MVRKRSESNAVGNRKFIDLNMSGYPERIDSKDSTNLGFNPNMKGFWSAGDKNLPAGQLPDYNMAEHVNSISDGLMAIQRILGTNPHVDYKGGNTEGTVSDRIRAAEDKDAYYDRRYGGIGWRPAFGQTILTHTHGGGNQQAPKITLTTEVQGKLPKDNVDLSAETGLTGADIRMSPTVSTKISVAINDKLSTSQGGTIQKDLEVLGKFQNRTYREWTAMDSPRGTRITDTRTLDHSAKRFSGSTQQEIIAEPVQNLLSGKYVMGVRVKVSSRTSDTVLMLGFYEHKQNGGWVEKSRVDIRGNEFDATNKWQMFYLVFDHEPEDARGHNGIRIRRLATSSNVNLDFDCAWVMPTHPAVFDR